MMMTESDRLPRDDINTISHIFTERDMEFCLIRAY